MLFISHNLRVIADVCDRVGVLYAGRLVEQGPVTDIFTQPAHPYTRGLLASLPGPRRTRGTVPVDGNSGSAGVRCNRSGGMPVCTALRVQSAALH